MKYNDSCINYKVNPFETVTINGLEWMKYNLAVDDGEDGITAINLPDVNGQDYGTQYFYDWRAAKRVADSIEGFRLPTTQECTDLIVYADGNITEYTVNNSAAIPLKSTEGWTYHNGTNLYGFNMIPVGNMGDYGHTYSQSGVAFRIWCNEGSSAADGFSNFINVYDHETFYPYRVTSSYDSCWNGLSVRLVKD